MEFNEKLQELRKRRGITQEELAEKLFVSRTAISKWESGRGYPSIDSLKTISAFFSVTIDELLSTDAVLSIAEDEANRKGQRLRDLIYSLLDLSTLMLLFLPFFAERADDIIQSVPLISLTGIQSYLRIMYYVTVGVTAIAGVVNLALQTCDVVHWMKHKTTISLTMGAILVLLFLMSSQPYAATFAFGLLAIKASVLIKLK